MGSNVSRRSFIRIATDSLITIPAAAAALATTPAQTLAAESKPEEGVWGVRGPVSKDGVLWTNEVKLIPLVASEVAFHVCDMSIRDPQKNFVPGAHIKITSRYNNKVVEGYTDASGNVLFDIAELAENPDNKPIEKLEKYYFFGTIEVKCDGYRDFLTGRMLVEGMETHLVPTRKLDDDTPYPAKVTFDGWDILYSDNTPMYNEGNVTKHALEVVLKNLGDEYVTVSLCEQASKKVIHSYEDYPSGGVLTGAFHYEFLHKGHPEALSPQTKYCMTIVRENGQSYEFPLALWCKESVFNEPKIVPKTDNLAPIGHKSGFSAQLSKIIPIGGGDMLKSWLPTFGPFEVSFDPGGSASVALIIAQNEWNGWGQSKEWKTRPDGTMEQTSSSHGAKPTSKDGWQWFPQKSIDDQWEKKRQDIVNSYKAYKSAKGDRKDIYYSKGFKMSVKLIAKGVVTWEGLKYTGKSLFQTGPGDLAWNAKNSARFTGALGFMIVASAGYEFCRNFFWGPVPMLFQFGINLTLTASALCSVIVDDPDKDRLDKVKRGEPVTDIWNVVTNLDNWNFDFTNTGFGLTVLFSPYISLGVGVKGVASASVRGAVMLTIYLGVPSRRKAMHDGQPDISDEKAYPSPHWIFSYQAEISVQLELFFFSYSISVCKGKKDNAYNNWPCKENNFKPGGGWAEGGFLEAAADEDVYFDSYAHRDLASVLNELEPMDSYFSEMVEARRATNDLSAAAEGLTAQAEDEQPVGYSTIIDDAIVAEDGTQISCVVCSRYPLSEFEDADAAQRIKELTAQAEEAKKDAEEKAKAAEEARTRADEAKARAEEAQAQQDETKGRSQGAQEKSTDAVVFDVAKPVVEAAAVALAQVPDGAVDAAGESPLVDISSEAAVDAAGAGEGTAASEGLFAQAEGGDMPAGDSVAGAGDMSAGDTFARVGDMPADDAGAGVDDSSFADGDTSPTIEDLDTDAAIDDSAFEDGITVDDNIEQETAEDVITIEDEDPESAGDEDAVSLAEQAEARATEADALEKEAEEARQKADDLSKQLEQARKEGNGEGLMAAAESPRYEVPAYDMDWAPEFGDVGLSAMADEPPITGIGSDGGVILNTQTNDRRWNPQGTSVLGSPRMQTATLDGVTYTFRIGVVSLENSAAKVARTRVIATVLSGEMGGRSVGTTQVIDFEITPAVFRTADVNTNQALLKGIRHWDLFDYDFAVSADNNNGVIVLSVVSGPRKLDGASNAENLAKASTDLVFSAMHLKHNPGEGPAFRFIEDVYSWHGSLLLDSRESKSYHCISNLQSTIYTDPDQRLTTTTITFLDRSGATPVDCLSDANAKVRMGFLYYCILSGGRGFFLKMESSAIEKVMGEIQDHSAYEMCFWPRSGVKKVNGAEYEAYNCFVIRGAKQAYYYTMRYRYSNPLAFDPNDLNRYVPKLNSLSFSLVATCDANTRLHLYGLEDGNPIFLGTEAVSDQFAVTPQQQATLSAMAEGADDSAALDDAYKRRLCIARLDEVGKKLSFSKIGPEDFGISSFGICGEFLYWPGTKDGIAGQSFDEKTFELVDDDAVDKKYLLGSRCRGGLFGDPFILADLPHAADQLVSLEGTKDALTVVTCGVKDQRTNTADLHVVRVPFVRAVNAIRAFVSTPYVVPGKVATFYITIRNDGNTYVSGCEVEMYESSDKTNKLGSATIAFDAKTTQASEFNAEKEDGSLEGVESDFALAPGKCSVYAVGFTIPAAWKGGEDADGNRITKSVLFRALHPTTKALTDGNGIVAQAEDEEGVEYHVDNPTAVMDEVPIEVEVYAPDYMSLTDAPVSPYEPSAEGTAANGTAASGNAAKNSAAAATGNAKTSNASRSPLANTGDGSSNGLAAGLGALGAAILAYERRRARNENK